MNYEQAEAIARMQAAIEEAQAQGPHDPFTRAAIVLRTVLILILIIPVTLLEIPVTLVGGCLIGCTMGLLLIPLTLLWLPQLGLLIGTSWLWLKVPLSRPFLLLPGVAIAVVADTYVSLMPDPEKDSKYTKLALASEWPLTFLLLRPDRLLGPAFDADGEGDAP